MKISRVKAVNFKGIKNIDVLLRKGVNKITGANGAGKSSLKDSIMATLCGAKYTPDIPVRIGQGKAEVTVDMGDFVVHGTYTKSSRRIEVESPDGATYKRPQELLDKCIGPLTFDPVSFFLAKPDKQVAMLKELVQVDFDDLNAQQAGIKQKRSDALKEKERLQHEAERIQIVGDVPDEEVSVIDLTTELQRILEHNHNVEQEEASRDRIRSQIEQHTEEIRELNSQIQQLKDSVTLKQQAIVEIPERPYEDSIQIHNQIQNIERTNNAVREKQRRTRLEDAKDEQSRLFSQLGQQSTSLDAERAYRLAKCKMPVKGLSLTDECVTFGELPLKQVNTGKQLQICVSIAMAMNPNLKTVFVKANDLDTENLEILENMIVEKDYQALIELADSSGKIGLVIEDGRIKKKE